ncbi:MAG: bifunctional UDP-sugar hydrolase/5'-nucleotidase [Halioglobus sp.]
MKNLTIVVIALASWLSVSSTTAQESVTPAETETITLLFTNDFESTYDPVLAFWRDDMEHIGGVAQLATLIEQIRLAEPNVFLFDSGDIFTGTLAKLTSGEVSLELMMSMGYDAMAIGNHEFEYGWEVFARQQYLVPFPVLGANLFYRGTTIPYARPHTIIERNGVRIGVIGIMGQDAATALIPSNIAGLNVIDPAVAVREALDDLRQNVDITVLLTHQGKTAPMQTDDSSPDVKRDIDADIKLAGAVSGVDVLFGGHADAGTEEPVVHPQTGTLIMQTYGQGFHLGYLKLTLDKTTGKIISHQGRLIPVDSENLQPHAVVAKKLAKYRSRFPELYKPVGTTEARMNRRYNEESDVGNLFADILRHTMDTQIGLINPGALRRDLPQGRIRRVDLLDVFPFKDHMVKMTLTGKQLRELLEQSLTLERGMLQVSGLRVAYDLRRPEGHRVVSVHVGVVPMESNTEYDIATIDVVAQGGDLYGTARQATNVVRSDREFTDVLEEYFTDRSLVKIPRRGRLLNSAQ